MDTRAEPSDEKGDVEKPPHGAEVGVDIMNLTKVFNVSDH